MEDDSVNNETVIKIIDVNDIPKCELILIKMFWLTLLPIVNSKYKLLKYCIPIIINVILGSASFCLLYYPSYYATDGEVWTTDIVISLFTYNYLIYLFKIWDEAKCFEDTNVSKSVNIISLIFYILYLIYWFYFAIIQFYTHSEPSILIQLGNLLMSTAWYFFFSTTSALYYFICIKLSQRSNTICNWLKHIKKTKPPIEQFYVQYNNQYKTIKKFAKYWNILIFSGSILLTLHVPIDLVSVIMRKYYYDIVGLIIKLLSLLWYIWRVCDLNDYDLYIVSYLHKHRIYKHSDIEEIEKYIEYRPVGLNFYGIRINKPFVIKILLIIINLIIPTIYALISNKIVK